MPTITDTLVRPACAKCTRIRRALGDVRSRVLNCVPTLRRALIQLNRALAWCLVASPIVQIATRTSFIIGLLIDIAIILVHGVLSLALFGLPRDRHGAEKALLVATGIGKAAVAPRNRLLLSGYRVLLGVVYLILLPLSVSVAPFGADVGRALFFILGIIGFYVLLRLPVSSLGHLFIAAEYAARRVGWRRDPRAVAGCVVFVFVVVSLGNLVK